MNMWVTHRLLNAAFIFNAIEYAKLDFYLCFYEFDLYASRRFWTLFFTKKYTLTYTRIDLYASIYGTFRFIYDAGDEICEGGRIIRTGIGQQSNRTGGVHVRNGESSGQGQSIAADNQTAPER